MKVFTCSFHGYWPVGGEGVIFAENKEEAIKMFKTKLIEMKLDQEIDVDSIKELDINTPSVVILNDGNY